MIRDLSPSQFSLAHLGLSEQGPVPLIEAAAASGFRAVGLPLRSGALKPLRHEIVGDPAMIRAIRRALAATGVQVFDVESLVLGYEPDADGLRRIFGTAAEIGASRMSCLGPEHGGDAARRAGTEEAGRLNAIARVAAVVRRAVVKNEFNNATPLHEAMTRDVITVTMDETLEDCMRLMGEKHIRHLPVVENCRLVGHFSIRDLMQWFIDQQKHKIDHLQNYIEGAGYGR